MERLLAKLRFEPADLGVLIILLLAGIKYTAGITHVLDVALYDESDYLHAGATLTQHGFPAPESGPLYALWYYVLSWLQPDRVRLFYLNQVLTTVLPPIFFYVWLRVNRVPVVVSTAAAAYFLITAANTGTAPRVTHFALLIVLFFCIAASFARRAETAVASVEVVMPRSRFTADSVRPRVEAI